jgi:hypothetical protein
VIMFVPGVSPPSLFYFSFFKLCVKHHLLAVD